jgi:hypothetical protein
MELLNNKLFSLISGEIKLADFEQWLYANEELLDVIDKDPFVFEIFDLNYKSEDALRLLDNLCKSLKDGQAYTISVVERECRKILETENQETILNNIYTIVELYTFESDDALLAAFYHLNLDIGMSIEGYGRKLNIVNEAHNLATQILNELKCKIIEEKKELLINRLPVKQKMQASQETKKSKFWYQFWK